MKEQRVRGISATRAVMLLAALATGCVTTRGAQKDQVKEELHFDAVTITADMELEKLNDEELMAKGEAAYGAEDYRQAARYFDRVCDFHPDSKRRTDALYNSGLSHRSLQQWEEALQRFHDLADPEKGTGVALKASFQVALALYQLERYDEAAEVLGKIGGRADVTDEDRIEAFAQEGICQFEHALANKLPYDSAEATLRKAVNIWQNLLDPDEDTTRYAAQAQYFVGEIYRVHYESVTLDSNKTSDELSKDLEYKAELLLSAQGHYLRCIRMNDGRWAIAAGSQIGGLYENLYDHMMTSPAPKELNEEEAAVYQQELRKKIRILITKAITIYERTLEAAERIGQRNPFVDQTRERLQKMKDLLLAQAQEEEQNDADKAEEEKQPEPQPEKTPAKKARKSPHSS
ncbi:MAG: tetratricopeptide repeat protein [Myxococcaceae bacterium]